MHKGKLVFPQVMAMLPCRRFQTCLEVTTGFCFVERYQGDKKTITLTPQEFFKIMACTQITRRES